jgi:hypothetical protein
MTDFELVKNLPIIPAWEKMKPIVEGLGERYRTRLYLTWFEYLYNEVKKREQRQ